MRFGERLKAARTARELTQDALASLTQLSQSTINSMETRKGRSSEHAAKLADALRVNLRWLVDGDGPMERAQPISADDRAILDLYHAMDPHERTTWATVGRALAQPAERKRRKTG